MKEQPSPVLECPSNTKNQHITKFATSLLALVLAFPTAQALASEAVPLRFLLTGVTVEENDRVAQLQVLRADDVDRPINVDFVTQSMSATPAADYTPVAGTLVSPPVRPLSSQKYFKTRAVIGRRKTPWTGDTAIQVLVA